MNNKVVSGSEMRFKEDIKLIEKEIAMPLKFCIRAPLFERDELTITHKDLAYHLVDAAKGTNANDQIKIYTNQFGLETISSLASIESSYLDRNRDEIEKAKECFIKNSVKGISPGPNGSAKGSLGEVVCKELVKKINEQYADLLKDSSFEKKSADDIIREIDATPAFCLAAKNPVRLMINDGRVYELLTIPDYISLFEKAFEAGFYKKAQKKISTGTSPEEVVEYLAHNKDMVNPKSLPLVKNKIWHSNRSFKLCMDGSYYVPQLLCKESELESRYERLLEYKIKVQAAIEYR